MEKIAGIGASSGASTDPGIAMRLDRLPVTRLHAAIVVVCALGLLFDVVEAALSNALSAVFSSPPHQVTPAELSLLLASVFAGGAVGAPLLGLLADRHGRRTTLALSLFVLTVTSAFAATSRDVTSLTAFRVLSGLALGAYPPLMVAYLSDLLPPARRGMLILIAGAIGFLGAPAVIFLIRWLTPLQPFGIEAWRWALGFGAAGSAIVGVLFYCLPESPRWLAALRRHAAADAACRQLERSQALMRTADAEPVAAPAPASEADSPSDTHSERFWSAKQGRTHRLRAALLGLLYFLSPWATIGFPVLSGAVLVEKRFRVSDSLLYVGVGMFGPTIGVLAGALVIDRFERRATLALCGGVMALIGLAFASSASPALLMTTGLAFNLVGAIYVAGLSVYAAELFPTALRASVSSGAWAVNRVASAVVPLALLPLLKTSGALVMFAVIGTTLLVGAALVLTLGPRGLAGRPVR